MLDDLKLLDVADWLLGPPLRIVAILLLAFVANQLGRRAVKRSLTKLHSGAVRLRIAPMRSRTAPECSLVNERFTALRPTRFAMTRVATIFKGGPSRRRPKASRRRTLPIEPSIGLR